MCLLIHKPAATTFTDEELRDFYKRNNDGFGFMYPKEGRLHIYKQVAPVESFIAAFREREDKEMFIHLRMRTHGDVDIHNCHPYPVLTREEGKALGPVWLMHNGVLSHGNDKDRSKSDTWHYINDVLRPVLLPNPLLLLVPEFQRLLAKDIGTSNKFALATANGDFIILNKSSGTEHKEAWFSNTYAWSGPFRSYSQGAGYAGYAARGRHYVAGQGWQDEEWDWNYAGGTTSSQAGSAATPKTVGTEPARKVQADTVHKLVENDEWTILSQILENMAPGARRTQIISDVTTLFFGTLKDRGLEQAYRDLSVEDIHKVIKADADFFVVLFKTIYDGDEKDEQYITSEIALCIVDANASKKGRRAAAAAIKAASK